MGEPVAIAIATGIIALIPVLLARRRRLLTPALYVLVIVMWSPVLKILYFAYTRPALSPGQLPADASLAGFLISGTTLALVAVAAYVVSYVLTGRREVPLVRRIGSRPDPPGDRSARWIGIFTLLCLTCFIAYLIGSDTEFFSSPFSAKRFLARDIGVESRFGYVPYYFFKAALVSGSVAYAAAYLLIRSVEPRQRTRRVLFGLVFTLALLLSHFASLRLFILLVVAQIALLVYYLRDRRQVAFMGGFAALTAASFVVITFVHRLPAAEMAAELARGDEGGERSASRALLTGEGGHPAVRWLARRSLGGRYFLDAGKLSHVVRHFPAEQPHALGLGFLGFLEPADADRSRALPGGMSRYLASEILGEPDNSVPPGYAGELYINFGWIGVAVGFLLLGALHRTLFTSLTRSTLSPTIGAALVLLIPNTTFVLLNSGVVSALSRSALDLGVFLLVFPLRGTRPVDAEPRAREI